MKWEEVREMYPNQFVKFEIVNSHIIDNKEIIDDITVISCYKDGKDAMKEFLHRKEGQFIYSTKNENVIIELVKNIGVRRSV